MSKERRQHSRFKSCNVIRAWGASGDEIQSDSKLINISEGGLLFYSNNAVQPEDTIRIRIEIEEFHSSIQVGARVKWMQRAMEKPNCYFVGVQFIEIDAADKNLLRKLNKHAAPINN